MKNQLQIVFLFFLLFLVSVTCVAQAVTPSARTTLSPVQTSDQANQGVVGIITGGVNGTYIRIAADMAAVLDADNLRILAIIGKGSVQNINDLLYLRGVDMAIVQSDVLEYLKRQRIHRDIEKKINYITKLYNEEFHLLANSDIANLNDLTGRKVNFDVRGSGTAITASILFDILGIVVEPTHYDQATALEKLKAGEISALAYVAGKPAQLFERVTAADQLRFLSIDPTPALLETYLPTSLGRQDYPNLVQADEEVRTIAVGAMLAVYNWRRNHQRYEKSANFTIQFFDRFNEFQEVARHPKWREVSLSAVIPGWTRFPTAQEWLDRQ